MRFNMSTTAIVHVRVDKKVKTEAAETLAAMGLTMSDAVRVFLTRVVAEQGLPFNLRTPNRVTKKAMEEADAIAQAHNARFTRVEDLFDSLEKNSGE